MDNWKILLIVFTLVAIAVALGLVIGLEDDKNDSNYKKGSTWIAVGEDSGANKQENILWSEDGKEWQVSTGVSISVQGYGVASDLLNPALKGKSAAPPF